MSLSISNADEWPIILTPKQVAEILQIGKTRSYELCHQRGFPAKRLGKTFRIAKAELLAWIAAHGPADES